MDTRNAATLATIKAVEPLNGIEYYALATLIKANLRQWQYSPDVLRRILDLASELAMQPPTAAEERLRQAHSYSELK